MSLFDTNAIVGTEPNRAYFDGVEVKTKADEQRLTGQVLRVFNAMRDGQWRTVAAISRTTGDPEPSIQADLRTLRKERFGAYLVERRKASGSDGLYEYRVGAKGAGTPERRRCLKCERLEREVVELRTQLAKLVS